MKKFLVFCIAVLIPVLSFAAMTQSSASGDNSSGAAVGSNSTLGIQAGNLPGGTTNTGGNTAGASTINTSANTSPLTNSSSGSKSCKTPTDIGTLFDFAGCVISSSIIPFIVGLAVLIFLIGVVQYVASGDNEEKREASRNMMIYGIIAIFVMVSVWGLVNILSNTFFGSSAVIPTLPKSQNNSALN